VNPAADRLLESIRKELDIEKRYELQREFQKVYYEDQPEACLWVPENPAVWVNRFENASFHSLRPGYNEEWWKVRGVSKKETASH
jgi:ABC-type transport system substrate-binding protein